MRAALLLALLWWQADPRNEPPVAKPGYMRYERLITVPQGDGQACAVLDAQIFPHAASSLADLRIFPVQPSGMSHEVPYAITLSEAATEETQPARVLNLGAGAGRGAIALDLEMPARAYTDVTLDIDPEIHDFIASATVSGLESLSERGKSTALGVFTLFDLSSQHLSRDTTLLLEESTFHYLHVVLRVSAVTGSASATRFAPAIVLGAEVPPSREAQTVYSTVAETAVTTTVGRETNASFVVAERMPVERVSFELAPGFKGNFSRDVRITAVPQSSATPSADDGRPPLVETVSGSILRVHANEAGREISTEQLGVPAILGANLQHPAKVDVAIENGDDQPLPIAAVRLEMRQRKLCFDATGNPSTGPGLALFYGDPALVAPVYDYDRLFVASRKPLAAVLGSELPNPNYHPPPAEVRPITERHPDLLWVALIAVVSALGVVALKSARNVGV